MSKFIKLGDAACSDESWDAAAYWYRKALNSRHTSLRDLSIARYLLAHALVRGYANKPRTTQLVPHSEEFRAYRLAAQYLREIDAEGINIEAQRLPRFLGSSLMRIAEVDVKAAKVILKQPFLSDCLSHAQLCELGGLSRVVMRTPHLEKRFEASTPAANEAGMTKRTGGWCSYINIGMDLGICAG